MSSGDTKPLWNCLTRVDRLVVVALHSLDSLENNCHWECRLRLVGLSFGVNNVTKSVFPATLKHHSSRKRTTFLRGYLRMERLRPGRSTDWTPRQSVDTFRIKSWLMSHMAPCNNASDHLATAPSSFEKENTAYSSSSSSTGSLDHGPRQPKAAACRLRLSAPSPSIPHNCCRGSGAMPHK